MKKMLPLNNYKLDIVFLLKTCNHTESKGIALLIAPAEGFGVFLAFITLSCNPGSLGGFNFYSQNKDI